MEKKVIMLVDDPPRRTQMRRHLERELANARIPHGFVEMRDGGDAAGYLDTQPLPDLIVCYDDVDGASGEGRNLLRHLREPGRTTPFILLAISTPEMRQACSAYSAVLLDPALPGLLKPLTQQVRQLLRGQAGAVSA